MMEFLIALCALTYLFFYIRRVSNASGEVISKENNPYIFLVILAVISCFSFKRSIEIKYLEEKLKVANIYSMGVVTTPIDVTTGLKYDESKFKVYETKIVNPIYMENL